MARPHISTVMKSQESTGTAGGLPQSRPHRLTHPCPGPGPSVAGAWAPGGPASWHQEAVSSLELGIRITAVIREGWDQRDGALGSGSDEPPSGLWRTENELGARSASAGMWLVTSQDPPGCVVRVSWRPGRVRACSRGCGQQQAPSSASIQEKGPWPRLPSLVNVFWF